MTPTAVPRLGAPIVFVHGLLGFNELRVRGWTVARYFPGIVEHLQTVGNRVLVASLSPTGGVAERAAQLREFIETESPGEPVHLFAHSMGGLDSRYMISRLGMDRRILTLTTIGTPHRGTVFADWGVKYLERVVKPVLGVFGLPDRSFYDVTTEKCRAFNSEVLDVPTVRYFSVAGKCASPWQSIAWALPALVVKHREGDNDGIVSVSSATYGEQMDVWTGDHLSLINWRYSQLVPGSPAVDRPADYAQLIRRLADLGF